MKSKSKFILSIIVLTVLLIGFLAGVFITAMFLSMKGFTAERLGLLLISLGFTGVTLAKMIRLNKREIKSRIDAVVNDRHDFIAQWKIPEGRWKGFLKTKLAFDIRESTAYGYISGGIVALILTLSIASSYPLMIIVSIAVGSFLVIFIMVKIGVIYVAKRKYFKYAKTSGAEIHFAKDLIIINGELVILNDFGYRLKTFQVEEKFDFNLLSFIVETGAGHKKYGHQHFIPIPEKHEAEADRLVTLYSALMH